MKANSNQAVLSDARRLGRRADVVSGGELRRALAAGIPGRERSSSRASARPSPRWPRARAGIKCFNVESEPELERLSEIASQRWATGAGLGPHQPRCRCRDPRQDLDRQGRRTSSASPGSRARRVYAASPRACRACGVVGVDMHIGSQITDIAPFDNAFALLAELVRDLRADGHDIDHVDVGGGLGIPYHRDDAAAARPAGLCRDRAQARRQARLPLVLEPGRLIVGNAGILVTRVEYVKEGEQDLRHRRCGDERPDPPHALRGASRHPAGRRAASNLPQVKADIVGPVCETGDYLAKDRPHRRRRRRATCSPS